MKKRMSSVRLVSLLLFIVFVSVSSMSRSVPIQPFKPAIHEEVTRDGLFFLKPNVLADIEDEHLGVDIEGQTIQGYWHFDNCYFRETIRNVNNHYDEPGSDTDIWGNMEDGDWGGNSSNDQVTDYFGELLHPAQDFYSHSNWVETSIVNPRMRYLFQHTVDEWWTPSDDWEIDIWDDSLVIAQGESSALDGVAYVWDESGHTMIVVTDDFRWGITLGRWGILTDECHDEASFQHGISNRPVYLNKDEASRPFYFEARRAATHQTYREWCRLVKMADDVDMGYPKRNIYDELMSNWVQDRVSANCGIGIPKTVSISSGASIMSHPVESAGSIAVGANGTRYMVGLDNKIYTLNQSVNRWEDRETTGTKARAIATGPGSEHLWRIDMENVVWVREIDETDWTQIVFASASSGITVVGELAYLWNNASICPIRPDGAFEPCFLTNPVYLIRDMVADASGENIYFIDSDSNFFKMSRNGTVDHHVGGQALRIAISPDGNYIFYIGWDRRIYRINRISGAVNRIGAIDRATDLVVDGDNLFIADMVDFVDGIPPRANPNQSPPANAAGWNNSDVTVFWNWTDNVGVPGHCPTTSVSSGEGSIEISATCTDLAGNIGRASRRVMVDKTSPTLNPEVVPNPVFLNGVATASSGASDSLSGVASESCGTLDTSSVGAKTVVCTATDNAGNRNSVEVSYNVIYDFAGFFPPVRNLPTTNGANAGRTIPLKFSLSGDQGLKILAEGYPVSGTIPCGSSLPGDIGKQTTSETGLQYDAGSDQYHYNWKTERSWRGTCRMLVVRFDDGTDHLAKFWFR